MHFRLLRKLTGLALVLLVVGTASLFAMSPKRMYQQGEKAEASGDLDGAFTAYAAASRVQPNEIQYQQAMERLRFIAAEAHVHAGEHQLEIGNTTDALREFFHALDIDPGSAVARQDLQKAQDLVKDKDTDTKVPLTVAKGNERPAAPPQLELKPQEPLTMQMVEQSTALYQALDSFLNCVRTGKKPDAGALEGYQATVVAVKANEAALKNSQIAFDPEWFKL